MIHMIGGAKFIMKKIYSDNKPWTNTGPAKEKNSEIIREQDREYQEALEIVSIGNKKTWGKKDNNEIILC